MTVWAEMVKFIEAICVTVTNFVPIGRAIAEVWWFLQDIRHLGFVIHMLGSHTKSAGGVCHCAKFGFESMR